MNSKEYMQKVDQKANTINSVINPFSLLYEDNKEVTRPMHPASANSILSNEISSPGDEHADLPKGFTLTQERKRPTRKGDISTPVPEMEYKYQPEDANFIIDLAALLMGMDPRTSDPSAVHHTVAKHSLDTILVRAFKAHPAVLELMETMTSDKKKERMRYRLAGCAQLLISATSPPRTDSAPSVLVVVYKAICRGLFEVLAVVFGVDTGCILNLMRSRTNSSTKVRALTKYFHVENGPGAREILLLFKRLVRYEKEKMDTIVNWIITAMYVDQMAPLFDSKYPGIIRADKYYKMREEGSPNISAKDARSVEILLQHTAVYIKNTPSVNFEPVWILNALNIPPAVAIAVTSTILECACENDAKMDFQGDLNREVEWKKSQDAIKDTGLLLKLIHKKAEVDNKPIDTRDSKTARVEIHHRTKAWSNATNVKVSLEEDKPLSIRKIQDQQALQSRVDNAIADPVVEEEDIEPVLDDEINPGLCELMESIKESDYPNTSMHAGYFLANKYPGFPGFEAISASSKMVDISSLIKPSPFIGLTEEDQGIVMESPCRDIFRKIVAGDRVRIDIPHQRLLIACILGDFEKKDDDKNVYGIGMSGCDRHENVSLKDRLMGTRHHTTPSDDSGIVCPRGNMCLIHGFIHDGIRRVQETCYDPRHSRIINDTLSKWKYLASYYSIIGGPYPDKRYMKKPITPPLVVPAWFIPPELWMKIRDKIDQGLEFNDNDFNSVGKNPMGYENSQLLQLWYLHQRVGAKMWNRWKSLVNNKPDFIEFRDIVFDSDRFENMRSEFHYTENTFRLFGVYIEWFHELLKVGIDRKVSVGFRSVDVEPLSITFAKEMKPYLKIVEWSVARRTLLPVFTYLDEESGNYVCRGRHLTRVEIHQLQEHIDLSRSMCEYTRDEDRILTYGRKITYERYAYRQLRIDKEEDKVSVPKLIGELSSGQIAHNRFLDGKANTLTPTILNLDDCVPLMNVIKNGNRVNFTFSNAPWFCNTCSLEFYSESELLLHRSSMHHMKCWLGMFQSPVGGYVEFKEQQESEISRIKNQGRHSSGGVLMSDLLPEGFLDNADQEKYEQHTSLEAGSLCDNTLSVEPRELTPIQQFNELFAKFGDRAVAIHIFLYDNVRQQLCRLMMLPPDSTFEKIEETYYTLVKWEKGASTKIEKLKKEAKSKAEKFKEAIKALELKQSEKTNNGNYKRRTHGARHSSDYANVKNKDKTFEPFEQEIRTCNKALQTSKKAHRDTETSLKSARSRLDMYRQMSDFWDILQSIESELQKNAIDIRPINVCLLCPSGKCSFPTAKIPETLREVMSPYYSAHPNINGGKMPTHVCGSCLNMIIYTTKPDSLYTVGKFVRYWATITVQHMKTGRPCDEHTSRIRMFDTLFGYGTPTRGQCQHCQLVPGNTKGRTIPGNVISKSVRGIFRKFLMKIPFDGEPECEDDEIEMDIGSRFAEALPTITCRVCFGRLVESVSVKLVEYGAGKKGIIDIAMLKAMYTSCSPADRKAIMRPISIANDLAGSCFSTARICVKIARFVGNSNLQNLIAPSTVGCNTAREMDKLSLKYSRMEILTDRFQYNSDTKTVSFLVQNNQGSELKHHLLSVMDKQSRSVQRKRFLARNNRNSSTSSNSSDSNFKWDNNHILVRKEKQEQDYVKIESKKQKDNQPTEISKPFMRNGEIKRNPFGSEDLVCALEGGSINPDTVVAISNPELCEDIPMIQPPVISTPDPEPHESIPQQYSLFLGHVFPTPGFLLSDGEDFIIRDMRDFKISSRKMLLFLVTGKFIKTGGIHITWTGENILIDTTGSGMSTYQIAGHLVRGFAAIYHPELSTVCEYNSQCWCYMKNGGNLCIRAHKHQDGGGLSF